MNSRHTCAADQIAALSNCSQSKTDPAPTATQDRGENRSSHVHPNEHRGHIDRIATHPRNRPIIIGRGDPEHIFN